MQKGGLTQFTLSHAQIAIPIQTSPFNKKNKKPNTPTFFSQLFFSVEVVLSSGKIIESNLRIVL